MFFRLVAVTLIAATVLCLCGCAARNRFNSSELQTPAKPSIEDYKFIEDEYYLATSALGRNLTYIV